MDNQNRAYMQADSQDSRDGSLWRLFLKIMVAILLAETAAMITLRLFFSSMPYTFQVVIDVLLLLALLHPTLYLLIIKPLLHEMKISRSTEDELSNANLLLQERKKFVESILTNMQSGILVTDPHMRIQLANPYVVDFFKSTTDGLVGKGLNDVAPGVCAALEEGRDSGECHVHRAMVDIIIGYRRFDMIDPSGAFCGHIISFVDLTEIIAIRRNLRIKERLATMGEVVARVAHEIRNPLFGMTAVGQILSRELILSPSQKELMESLLKEAGRLNRMVEDLLFCSREPKLNRKPFALTSVIGDTLRVSAPYAEDRRVTISSQLPEHEVTVHGDQEKIEQVLLNVVKNAVEATPTGGSVSVAIVTERGNARITVSDTGIGIPDDVMEKIFDVFYSTKKNGAGLGLSISKTIIEAHGGTLTAENNPAGGARFTISLPHQEGLA